MADSTHDDVLDDVPALSDLDPDLREALGAQMEVVSYEPGEQVHPAGEPWRALYAVIAGGVRLRAERPSGGDPLTLDVLQGGATVGHEMLFGREPAPYEVRAEAGDGATLLRLTRGDLAAYWETHPEAADRFDAFVERRTRMATLQRSGLFSRLPPERRRQVAEALTRTTLSACDVLIEEGDRGRALYLIEEGRFRVFHRSDPSDTLHEMVPGDVVGEIALRTGEPRTATVRAETDASVFALSKDDFEALVHDDAGADLVDSIDALVEARRVDLGPDRPAPERAAGDGQAPSGEALPEIDDATPAPVDAASDDDTLRDQPYAFREPLRYRFGWYPAVEQQSVMDCGAACLSTVCRYYGKRVSLNHMRRLAHVGQSGASMLHLKEAAETLGFRVDPFLSTYDQLAERTADAPAIVNWRGYHWIVVYEVTDTTVTVADPGSGLDTKDRDDFEEGWTRYTLFLEPTAQVDAIEEEEPTIQQFLPYVRPYRRLVGEVFGASIATQVVSVFVPLFSKFILDEVINQQDPQWLVSGVVALSLLLVGNTALKFFRNNLLLYVTKRVNLRMMEDFLDYILALPLPYFERRKTGDITGRFEENRTITDFLTEKGVQPFVNAFSVVVYLGLMLYLNVPLTLVVVGFLALNVLNVKVISPRLREAYREVFQRNVDSESFLIEVLKGLGTVKSLGIERSTRWQWDDLNTRQVNSYFRSLKYSIASSLVGGLINNLVDVGVLFVGALMVFDGTLTVGGLVAFQLLAKGVTAPVLSLVRVWDEFQEALNAVERLNDVYDTEREIRPDARDRKVKPATIRGHVEFENVTFRYAADSETNVVQNVTLQADPGAHVAFVGRSGSGKSTLIKLLLGFYPPTSGTVFVDGFNVQDLWLPALRRQIAVVSQDTQLFEGTVRENIAHGRPGAPATEIETAARRAHADGFIEALPRGYDTVLDNDGSTLSGGQRQRIAIARALIQKPSILILDEATSALDNEAERYVQHNIETEMSDCTTFTIAHRLSTVRDADEIVVLDRGHVLERGTHEELMANGELYYYLSTEQLELG